MAVNHFYTCIICLSSSELWLLIGLATLATSTIVAIVNILSPDGWRGRYAQQLDLSSKKYYTTRKKLNCHNATYFSIRSLVRMVSSERVKTFQLPNHTDNSQTNMSDIKMRLTAFHHTSNLTVSCKDTSHVVV